MDGSPFHANHPAESRLRRRKRTSYACDVCRHKKIRCDGGNPCATCVSNGESGCIYGADSVPKSRGNVLLEVALRSERAINDLNSRIATLTGMVSTSRYDYGGTALLGSPSSPTAVGSFCGDTVSTENINNATISQFHKSNTESVLGLDRLDYFPELEVYRRMNVFQLEQSRARLLERPSPVHPFTSLSEVDRIILGFQESINTWYPTMNQEMLADLRTHLISGRLDSGLQSCLALLTMALGSAYESVQSSCAGDCSGNDSNAQLQQRTIGDLYFDAAMKMIHRAFMEIDADAIQCLFFAALYFAFLQRPLQAWSFLHTAATKCRSILSYTTTHDSDAESECIRRIFWSCYILESDYLSELTALPQSGIADIESSVRLPGEYHTQKDQAREEEASLYFIACISMRRLLNRTHHLLFAKDTGAILDGSRLPSIVAELHHQLDEWHDLLPLTMRFSCDQQLAPNSFAGFLRQRYLACKSLIYRPFLTQALSNSNGSIPMSQLDIERCQVGLDACVKHILNLQSFPHTVMIDTWICSLSMASAMLICLAACRIADLFPHIAPKAKLLGPHLELLLGHWMYIPDSSASPSVEESVRIIICIDGIFKGWLL